MRKKRPWQTDLSSLVITLSQDQETATSALKSIQGHAAISTETLIEHYLPITIEATDARPIHEWIESLPGVDYIDVVFCTTTPPQAEAQLI
jgi:hypothetical protein